MVNKLAEEMGIPTWGLVAIGIGEYGGSSPWANNTVLGDTEAQYEDLRRC